MQKINEETINKNMRVLWFIWGVLIFSILIYIRICHMFEDQLPLSFFPKLPIAIIKYVLYSAATLSLVFSCLLRGALLKMKSGKSKEKLIRRAAKQNRSPIILKYNLSVIVSVLVAGYASFFCTILFFLGGGIQPLYVFSGISFPVIFYLRPKRKEFEQLSVTWDDSNDVV